MAQKFQAIEDFTYVIDKEVDASKIKQFKNSAETPFLGSPHKLSDGLHTAFEERFYKIEQDELKKTEGEIYEQVQNVVLRFFGRKRRDVKGRVFESKSFKPLGITGVGAVIFFIGFATPVFYLISIPLIVFGIALFALAPPVKYFTYYPCEMGLWTLGSGTASLGTKSEEVKDASEASARGLRKITSSYVVGETNLKIGSKVEKFDRLYGEKLLLDKQKTSVGLGDLVIGIVNKKPYISIQSEEEYRKLLDSFEKAEEENYEDFKYVKNMLRKFSGTH